MKTIFVHLIIIFMCSEASLAQVDCVTGRYTTDVFSSFTKTTVQYGKNIGINTTDSIDLMMDIYEPVEDMVDQRPVLIWAHGGSFISGQRADMAGLCEQYVRMGYVTATIDYHLWPIASGFPDSIDIFDVVVKAIGDMKGAIRYFKADQAGENLFGIDSTRIVIGGISAGGILAMHTGHLDNSDPIPQFIQEAIDDNGGLEGEANSLTNSSDILTIVNLSGALYDRNFIGQNDPPFTSYHGTADDIVPFRRGFANGITTLEGSALCHERADLVNIANQLDSVNGGGHTDIYNPFGQFADNLITFFTNANVFIGNKVCPDLISAVQTFIPAEEINLYPNPAANEMTIEFPEMQQQIQIRLFDQLGRIIYYQHFNQSDQFKIDKPINGKGIYFLELSSKTSNLAPVVKKVVFQ